MSLKIIESWTTPNQSSRASYGWYKNPDGITWHWWERPEYAGTFESTVNFFVNESPKRPLAQRTSAHFVVSDTKVACLVSPSQAAWHAGSTEGNGRTIGIEVDPRMPGQTLETCAQLSAYLEGLYGSLKHYGHRDWSSTQCPGDVYPKIGWIVDRTNAIRRGSGVSQPVVRKSSAAAMVLPVGDARVSQAFGQNGTSYNLASGGHTGYDYAVPVGTKVHAPVGGTVVWADWVGNLPGDDSNAGWASRWYLHKQFGGIVVVIDHGAFLSVVAHLSRTDMNVGDRVSVAQVDALSGATGAATGPHVHWEILPKPFNWSNGYYGRVNPVAFRSAYNRTHAAVQAASVVADDEEAELAGRVDEIVSLLRDTKKRVDIIWGGVFTEFSYSGKPGTNEPGIIPRLKTLEQKVKETKSRVDIIWGGVFTEYSMSGKPGTNQPGILRRLETMQKEIDALKEARNG